MIRSNSESDEELPTDKTQFNEDGEVMVMEINDEGAAAQEFASESDNSEDSNSDSAKSSDDETGFVSDGEIIDDKEDAEWMNEGEDSQASNYPSSQDDEPNDRLCKDKKKKKKAKRKSMEDKIDTMSNTLLAWQQIMMKNGLLATESDKERADNRKRNKNETTAKRPNKGEENLAVSNSDTIIYQNVLNKQTTSEVIVDPEITIKRCGHLVDAENAKNRQSSSSEEIIDTNDELMEVDVNDPFVAGAADR